MASNILKFHPSNLITGINIVDDMLFFTDGVNEPKKIDLNIFRAADHSTGNTIVYGRNFQERDITVIRPHPQTAITTTTSTSTAVINPIASAPNVQTLQPFTQSTDVVLRGSSTAATLPFTKRGFVYKQIDSITPPTLQELLAGGIDKPSHLNGGKFEEKISGLILTKRYYYIAYAQNAVSNRIYATNVDGTDDIETFVINDTSNALFTPNLAVRTMSITPGDLQQGKGVDGKAILYGTITSGTQTATIQDKGFMVYKTVTTDTVSFSQGDILVDASQLNNKTSDVLFYLNKNQVHNKYPNGTDDPSGHNFVATVDITFGEKIFAQAFASTSMDTVERVGNILSFPISGSTDPNNKVVQHKPNPLNKDPDQLGTSVTMRARIPKGNWHITTTGRLERGFYFSKKRFDVKKITQLTFPSTTTLVDQGVNGNIEWNQATNDSEIYRVSQFWDGGYLESEQEYAVSTSEISGFNITKDEDIFICAFGRSTYGEGYERNTGFGAVRRFKAGTGDSNTTISVTATDIRFTAGKIEVDVTVSHDAPVATEMGLYLTSQPVGVELGNGSAQGRQGVILDRARRQNDNFARMTPGKNKDINNKIVLDSSTGKVQANDFTFQYGFDSTRFPITAGTANVSAKLPLERKDYYAMPFVKVNNQEIYGKTIGPPKLGNINEPPDIQTLNYTGNQISGGHPRVTFNGQIFPQVSNTPTLTEAGFVYGTDAQQVASGVGNTVVAVSNTVTSNTPNSISLLQAFLAQQTTAGVTPKFSVPVTLTGQHGDVIYYIAYVKISADGGNTLHLAEDDNQTGDYGKGVVKVQLQGTAAVQTGHGTRLPVPHLDPATDIGFNSVTLSAKQGDNGGGNKSLVEMLPKFYYMKESVLAQNAALYRGNSSVTEATTQAYIKNNVASSPNSTSGIINVSADNDDLASIKNAIASVVSGLDEETRYIFFVTANNGANISNAPFANGEGPSRRCYSFLTIKQPITYPNGQRAFYEIVYAKPTSATTADVRIRWTGGGISGISTHTKHGVYFAKTSAMGSAPYDQAKLWNANPAKTFVSSARPGEITMTLTGLEPSTEYHVMATCKNDNTLPDLTGMAGSAGEGLSALKKFTMPGSGGIKKITVSPTRIVLESNGKVPVITRNFMGLTTQKKYVNPSFTVNVSPKSAKITEKDIVFPAYNFLNPQVIVNKSKIHTAGNGTFRVEFQVNENIGFFAKKSLGGTIKVNHPDGGIAGKEVEVSQAGPIGTGFKFSFP